MYQEMIVCFCEECLEEFKSYIAKDICPTCSKIFVPEKEKIKFERIIKTKRYEQ